MCVGMVVHCGGRVALDFVTEGQGMKGRLKVVCDWKVGDESMKIGLSREDVFCGSRCILGVNLIATGLK